MSKTLFLDFDGPLFPDRYISFHAKQNLPYPGKIILPSTINYWAMDPLSVEMLNSLYEIYQFQTVVSSSWRKYISKEQCIDLFSVNGLKLHLAENWKTDVVVSGKINSCSRASEIYSYIKEFNITDYIILDDIYSGESLKHCQTIDKQRVVFVNCDMGISSGDFLEMKRVVRKWAGLPDVCSFSMW